MIVYADSSFIVALYLQQQSSARAVAFLEDFNEALPFTPWHRLEVRNAIRMAVWQKLIDSKDAKTQLKQLDIDLKEESLLVHQPVDWTDVLRMAEKLGERHNQTIGCRSSDLFHVAAAVESRYKIFLTFDQKQTALARAAGLSVKP